MVGACPEVVYSKAACVVTCIGEAEADGVPTGIGEALATGNPLLKLGALLAVVATLCTVIPRMVPRPMLVRGIGIVMSGATGVVADWDARLEASCRGGMSAICGVGVGISI